MKVGDLVIWPQGHCDTPGLILEKKPASKIRSTEAAYSSSGNAVLAMLPELGNELEWFHECELEVLTDVR